MTDEVYRAVLCSDLQRRQLPSGGWAATVYSKQASLETSCFAGLAIGSSGGRSGLLDFLAHIQNPNGSWPAFEGDDREGAWVTSLALIALRDHVSAIRPRLKGFQWLLHVSGKEAHWLWKWKFRTSDRHVRFDPNKYGWPWFPDTLSWVVPTSFAMVALRQIPCGCGERVYIRRRVDLGAKMLMDRACPGGGWNAGNGLVYGSPLRPHPDDTSVALLALCDKNEDPQVNASVCYLEAIAQRLCAPWSLAWSVLALAAHGKPVRTLLDLLRKVSDGRSIEDTSTLAITILAFDCHRALNAFGVRS